MARRAKIVTQTGCNTPGLAMFAKHFVQALGPVDDVTEVSALLGRNGRRVSDPALRRRMISARIALLAEDGSRYASATPEALEKIEAPEIVQVDAEPLVEWVPEVKPDLPTSMRTGEFLTQSLADVARLLSESDAETVDPINTKAKDSVEELAENNPNTLEQKADPENDGAVLQADTQINISTGPAARYAQATTRVMNVARESEAATPPKKPKKTRPKASDPIDFSALAQLGTGGDDQTADEQHDPAATDLPAKAPENSKAV